MKLDSSVQYLKGVGEQRAKALAKLGIRTVGELLSYYPKGYIDFTSPYGPADVPPESVCAVKAAVCSVGQLKRIGGGRTLLKVYAADDSGTLEATFFNNPYISKKLKIGEEYIFYGKAVKQLGGCEMISPTVISANTAPEFCAVYPLTAGITSAYISKCVKTALEMLERPLCETLPQEILSEYNLPSYDYAVEQVHFPVSAKACENAKRRLVFEELYIFQLGLFFMKNQNRRHGAIPLEKQQLNDFYSHLPFTPTGAQKRAIDEICADLKRDIPMNRLLQGDVGSGKTLVAAAAMLVSAQNGKQSVLMAPTEILARQHAETLSRMLSPFGVNIALITGGLKGREKAAALAAVADGQADIIVGTHAVLSENVKFSSLALAVTDEQHRFGVNQRGALSQKGSKPPHILVMSATPIPRTLALLIYGDLEISVLDEIPPGRTPVKTYLINSDKRARMFGFIKKYIAEGRQAFIVCPMISESDSELMSVNEYYEHIAKPLLPDCKVGVMHGKMKPQEKAEIMQAFSRGEIDVLCSTTVVEVGVDVPNANIMVIENSERYGLSTLHQLRGRVGRGAAESFCILVSDCKGENARDRLRFICKTQNGFDLAQKDLETRGPGDFFGSRQHGIPALKIAGLISDSHILYLAQTEAKRTLQKYGTLENIPPLYNAVEKLFGGGTALN